MLRSNSCATDTTSSVQPQPGGDAGADDVATASHIVMLSLMVTILSFPLCFFADFIIINPRRSPKPCHTPQCHTGFSPFCHRPDYNHKPSGKMGFSWLHATLFTMYVYVQGSQWGNTGSVPCDSNHLPYPSVKTLNPCHFQGHCSITQPAMEYHTAVYIPMSPMHFCSHLHVHMHGEERPCCVSEAQSGDKWHNKPL